VTGTPDHVLRNRSEWDQWAADYAGAGLRNWAAEASWGIWGVPAADAGVLPPDLNGRDSIELGCGTGYVSAWLARRGARSAGLDNSAAQLTTARELQRRFGLRFPLIHASAEQAAFADASFDLAISEYGASIWCDPYAWIPEAARLLRPGGQLIFLVNSVLLMLTSPDQDGLPATERRLRPYFGMHRLNGQTTSRWSFTLAMATRSGCYAAAAWRLRISWNSGPSRAPPHRTRSPPSNGHSNGPVKKSGRPANHAEWLPGHNALLGRLGLLPLLSCRRPGNPPEPLAPRRTGRTAWQPPCVDAGRIARSLGHSARRASTTGCLADGDMDADANSDSMRLWTGRHVIEDMSVHPAADRRGRVADDPGSRRPGPGDRAFHGRPGKAGTWPLPGTVGRIARADAAGTACD
jgi:SAM-dependent methyltransferase